MPPVRQGFHGGARDQRSLSHRPVRNGNGGTKMTGYGIVTFIIDTLIPLASPEGGEKHDQLIARALEGINLRVFLLNSGMIG